MRYSFHPEAKEEFIAAIDYFEDCRAGLGIEFTDEVFSAIQNIIRYPEGWSKFYGNSRRCLIKRFPFGIVYFPSKQQTEIIILAVMQLNRKPDYWKKRLDEN